MKRGTSSIRFCSLVVASLISLAGCAGGTIGTGIGQRYGSHPSDRSLRFGVRGVVVDKRGRPLSGVSVNIETFTGFRAAETDASGRFEVVISMQSGEKIRFGLRKGDRTFEAQKSVSPAGSDTVEMIFTLEEDGHVDIKARPL